jgi:hypothetical protein
VKGATRLSAWDVVSSAWMIPVALVCGWGPLFGADLLIALGLGSGDTYSGIAMAWLRVALVCTLLAVLSFILQVVKLLVRATRRHSERSEFDNQNNKGA